MPAKPGSYKLLSLFSGAGGLDLGFEEAGFEIAGAFDIRPDAISSYNHNREDRAKVGHVTDIRELSAEKLDAVLGTSFAPRGVIGGPPCQSFSRATHSSDDDPRHNLPLKYAQLLGELNERHPVEFFVFENVPGLLDKKHQERFETFLRAFDDAGFTVTKALLNARHFGVPQNRPRVILVGLNRRLMSNANWTPPLYVAGAERDVRSAIGHLPEATHWKRGMDVSEIAHHRNHWCMAPKSISFFVPGRLSPGTSRGRSFRTLEWDKVSPTVAYGHREVHVHPNCHRRLSVHEALLLQGFPKDFELLGSLSSQITQVSEAVPPPMAFSVAQSLIAQLDLNQDATAFSTYVGSLESQAS